MYRVKYAFLVCLACVYVTACDELQAKPSTSHAWSVEPPPFVFANHSLQRTSLWGDVQGPYPTNAWWTNLILDNGNGVVNTLPYLVKLDNQGLYISYPGRTVTATYIINFYIMNFGIAAVEPLTQRHVTSHDLMSVTMKFGNGDSYMSTPLIKGTPYLTLDCINVTPKVVTQHAILSVNGKTGAVTANKFAVALNNGQTWIIYSTGGQNVTFAHNGVSSLQATGKFTGTLRVALAPSQDAIAVLDQHSAVIPIGCQVVNNVEGDVATISFKWQTTGVGNLLMLALPHHMDSITNATTTLARGYRTIKGYMTGIIGNTWNLQETLTTVSWHSPRSPDANKIADLKAALLQDQYTAPRAADSYFFSKEISAMARVALIAESLGELNISNRIIDRMISTINPWLVGTNWNPLKYDQTWKGVCTSQGLLYQAADFGQGWYNDHHYHFGYFTYATAVIARHNPAWFQQHKEQVLALVRDYANPTSSDPYFPISRHKDWFDGHSWASGLVNFGDGKNQESTSEAVNAYYAAYLLGLAIGDQSLANYGRILLATEIRSTQKYWQITNSSTIYDAPFTSAKVVGMVWQLKVDQGTWFGGINVPFTHTIQMFPFTPITEQLLRRDWVVEEYPVLRASLDSTVGDGWKGFIFMDHAILDKESAWQEVKTLRAYDDGNSKINTLYWIATRP